MKRSLFGPVLLVVAATALSACEPKVGAAPESAKPEGGRPAVLAPATPVAPGAPAFAALYPGSTPTAAPTVADGPSGPGGMAAFTTPDGADKVVAFYKTRAEASGLSSVSAMDQGEARAYAAADADGGSASLQVVAQPDGEGKTTVQLMWSAGQ